MRTTWMPVAMAAALLSGAAAIADEVAESAEISHGERVEIKEHLASGYYTLLVFHAEW